MNFFVLELKYGIKIFEWMYVIEFVKNIIIIYYNVYFINNK